MTTLNFFGDFKIDQPATLCCSDNVHNLINDAEFNVLNFEAPIKVVNTPVIKKSGPHIFQNNECPRWIERNGFNIVSLANNHICDMGIANAVATKNSFESAICIGVGSWDEAYSIYKTKSKDGTVIGFLACTHLEFGTLYDIRESDFGAAWSNHSVFRKTIINARDQVDVLIVYAHGGIEYMEQPLPEWREIYKEFVDLGADAVIASHPHVPQGWEVYNGKLICYSLGNLCFNLKGHERDYWNNSLCCTIKIDESRNYTFEFTPLMYNPARNIIDTNIYDVIFQSHLDKLNKVLGEEDTYFDYVNDYLINLLPQYIGQFSRSGYLNYKGVLPFIKGGLDFLKGREIYNKAHMINNIRCESHRWAILRAFNLLYLNK